MHTSSGGSSAIVIGSGIAGLLAARVLSGHVDRVTMLERDLVPWTPAPRRGVPQGRHAHVLLASGQRLLEEWFPLLSYELRDRGAVPLDAGDLVWHQAGGHRVRSGIGFLAMSLSRPMLECAVRTRLLEDHDVTLEDGVRVERPLLDGEGRVVGVVADGVDRYADLVVDCSGRNSRMLAELARTGYPEPEREEVRIDVAYRTRTVSRRRRDMDGTAAVILRDVEHGGGGATMTPIEGDRWMLTAASFHGDPAPDDALAFERFAYGLPSAELTHVVDRSSAHPDGSDVVERYGMRASRRNRLERLRQVPAGLVLLGDALCTFDPVYGQGMSSAALQAQQLGRVLDGMTPDDPALPRAYYRRAAKVVDAPWRIAAGGDFADPRTTGDMPRGTRLLNAYLLRVLRACQVSVPVADAMMRVQNLLASPALLLSPPIVWRVLTARHHAEPPAGDREHVARSTRPWRVPARPVASADHLLRSALTGGAAIRWVGDYRARA
ncbi:FAD-dependent oxidoreductase [Agromyces sp. SYSU T00194]|uniref:FAD-dependent oxidoreductase n=1 Tax=Agromyces chitinivorans TaxID=3158560 RepID=UPI0033970516